MELDKRTDPLQNICKCALQITKPTLFIPLTVCQSRNDQEYLEKGIIFVCGKYLDKFKATRLSS
jgi:hypothetical protein